MRFKSGILILLILAVVACRKKGLSSAKGDIDSPDTILVEEFLQGYKNNCSFSPGEEQSTPTRVIQSMNSIVKITKNGSSATGFLVAAGNLGNGDTPNSSRYILTNQHVVAPIPNEYCAEGKKKVGEGPEEDWIYRDPTTKCERGSPRPERNEVKLVETAIDTVDRDGRPIQQKILVAPEDADGAGTPVTLHTPKKMFYQGDIAFQKGTCSADFPIIVDFGFYESGQNGSTNRPEGLASSDQKMRCAKILIANQEYDFAVLELEKPPVSTPSFVYRPLQLDTNDPSLDEKVFLVGHPNGSTKRVTLTNHNTGTGFDLNRDFFDISWACKVKLSGHKFPDGSPLKKVAEIGEDPALRKRYPHTLLHDCDTMYGNSGSPVMRRSMSCLQGEHDLKVVGLHWSGWQVSKGQYFDPAAGAAKDNGQYVDGNTSQNTSTEVEEDDIFRAMPYSKANSMIRISEIKNYLQTSNKFASDVNDESLKPLFGADAPVLEQSVSNLCSTGVNYIDDLAAGLGSAIIKQCKKIKTFRCKNGDDLCGCKTEDIRWTREPDDCELADKACSTNPQDLRCVRFKETCQARKKREPNLWEKAKDLIDAHHVCYVGQKKLGDLKSIFHIGIDSPDGSAPQQ
jgi:hypothetical protein